jgi:hypothetical protein
MRIIDENGNEILNPNYDKGYTDEEEIFIAHHDAIPGVEEVGHYETVHEYPNGGRDVEWVIDIPGVEAHDAWDEYETILRWHWYPEPEPERASDNYNAGSFFEENGKMYEATSTISRGERITPGVNCNAVTLAQVLNIINSQGG